MEGSGRGDWSDNKSPPGFTLTLSTGQPQRLATGVIFPACVLRDYTEDRETFQTTLSLAPGFSYA